MRLLERLLDHLFPSRAYQRGYADGKRITVPPAAVTMMMEERPIERFACIVPADGMPIEMIDRKALAAFQERMVTEWLNNYRHRYHADKDVHDYQISFVFITPPRS